MRFPQTHWIAYPLRPLVSIGSDCGFNKLQFHRNTLSDFCPSFIWAGETPQDWTSAGHGKLWREQIEADAMTRHYTIGCSRCVEVETPQYSTFFATQIFRSAENFTLRKK